jgi:sugar phosphate isomerase/epimerase
MSEFTLSRRRLLGGASALLAAGLLRPSALFAAEAIKPKRYKIAVCDWMILKRQKLSAFELTKEIGADGVEVDMGSLGSRPTFENQLAKPEIRKQFLDKAKELNLEISSIAMSGFYAQPFVYREGVEDMVQDCIDTMVALGVKTAFLPLGGESNLLLHPNVRPRVLSRLKAIAPLAEDAGVVIGIETALPADAEANLLDEIGSKSIRSYFNFENALQSDRDLLSELRILGKDRICQIHCTDKDGVWLQDNTRLDMQAVKDCLDEMDWSGWMVIERSRDKRDPSNVKHNFGANTKYLKQIFQAA